MFEGLSQKRFMLLGSCVVLLYTGTIQSEDAITFCCHKFANYTNSSRVYKFPNVGLSTKPSLAGKLLDRRMLSIVDCASYNVQTQEVICVLDTVHICQQLFSSTSN